MFLLLFICTIMQWETEGPLKKLALLQVDAWSD